MFEALIAANAAQKAVALACTLAIYVFMDVEDRKQKAADKKAQEEATWQEIYNL